jgi:hypothetical protein
MAARKRIRVVGSPLGSRHRFLWSQRAIRLPLEAGFPVAPLASPTDRFQLHLGHCRRSCRRAAIHAMDGRLVPLRISLAWKNFTRLRARSQVGCDFGSLAWILRAVSDGSRQRRSFNLLSFECERARPGRLEESDAMVLELGGVYPSVQPTKLAARCR